MFNAAPDITGLTTTSVSAKYGDIVTRERERVFESFPLTRETVRQLESLAMCYLAKWPPNFQPHASGVVIAGFGAHDMYPSCNSIMVDGVVNDVLRCGVKKRAEISSGNAAYVVPFAQREMVFAFMEGVDPDYQSAIERDIWTILTEYPRTVLDIVAGLSEKDRRSIERKIARIAEKKLKDSLKKFDEYRRRKFSYPITRVVSMLPKDELATMAETLVELTSFRRKMSMDAETVAGPIDVAVISKGDGLVWIKRKHYFKPEMNHHFFATYYREEP